MQKDIVDYFLTAEMPNTKKMKKRNYILLAAALMFTMGAQAQIKIGESGKLAPALKLSVDSLQRANRMTRSTSQGAERKVLVAATDSREVADSLLGWGYAPKVITDRLLSVTLPVGQIERLSSLEAVEGVDAVRRFRPLMNNARRETGVDKVQAGTGLETPYTGKGVIIGVIDQGFQYNHIAFTDGEGKSRIAAVWNHQNKGDFTENVANAGSDDGMNAAGGHATHVAGIAAGRTLPGNDLSGMAPDANLVLVSSGFADDDLIEEATKIKEFAEKKGMPWVINMSFGGQYGPHDGSTSYDQTMNALTGPGGVMVAAMGNEKGADMHVSHTFTTDGEKVYLAVTPINANNNECDYNIIDIWGQNADGKQHLEVTPYVMSNSGIKQLNPLTDAFWNKQVQGEINRNNNKEHYLFQVDHPSMASAAKIISGTNAVLVVEVSGKAGDTFHAWAPFPSDYGKFTTLSMSGKKFVKPDSKYLVGEGAASIPNAVAVASYNASTNFTSWVTGNTYGLNVGTNEEISNFSSPGPWLGSEPKPTVAAPGGCVTAPYNKYQAGFDITQSAMNNYGIYITSAVSSSTGQAAAYSQVSKLSFSMAKRLYDFYGEMSGTSMATPAMTGIIALWLEANPTLSYKEIKEIISQTSDASLNENKAWDSDYGYGKVNAYEGLKAALRISSGIYDVAAPASPVTILMEGSLWKILFNSTQDAAKVSVVTLGGEVVRASNLGRVSRGAETTLSAKGLQPGVYLVRIDTPSASLTKKFVVGR